MVGGCTDHLRSTHQHLSRKRARNKVKRERERLESTRMQSQRCGMDTPDSTQWDRQELHKGREGGVYTGAITEIQNNQSSRDPQYKSEATANKLMPTKQNTKIYNKDQDAQIYQELGLNKNKMVCTNPAVAKELKYTHTQDKMMGTAPYRFTFKIFKQNPVPYTHNNMKL